MIIDQLTIEDFGVYAGRQTIDLLPPSNSRPIILIGGLNGGGKTTLLDAIHLCLYGKFAPCSNRGTLAYHEFLRRSINQRDDQKDAAVELAFRHTVDGAEEEYRVVRAWSLNGNAVVEQFQVIRNGEEDEFLARNWTEAVERILPRRIANLFLFDGEKIESYASPDAASELIRTAAHSLLGMDIVDQLERDLDTLKQRKRSGTSDMKLRSELEKAQQEFDRLGRERHTCHQELASLRTHDLGKTRKRFEALELEFQQKGGPLFERQKEIENQLTGLKSKINDIEEKLRELAAGNLPLALVAPLLQFVVARGREEDVALRNRDFVDEARNRDADVLKVLAAQKAPEAALEALRKFFSEDVESRLAHASIAPYLGLTRSGLAGAEWEIEVGLIGSEKTAKKLLQKLSFLNDQRQERDAELSSVPAEEVVQQIIVNRGEMRERLYEIEQRIKERERDLGRLDTMLLRAKQRLAKLTERRVRSDFEEEDQLRVINHASRVQETLAKFRNAAIKRHIGQIEQFITESFKELHRKDNFIEAVRIDPKSFSIELRGDGGIQISPDRLSAGERQMLAVAILWGLARASNRQLPIVIDTPLGRLDSEHRGNLVDHYFPHASHQVILLSTDEEIANGYLERIRDRVGKMYELVFDKSDNSTTVRPGYFALEPAHVH